MSTTPTQRLHEAVAAVAPLTGLVVLPAGTPPEPGWHVVRNQSVNLDVNLQYRPEATPAQIQAGDDVARTFDLTGGERQPRPLWKIRNDIQALTAAQFTAVWNDLSAAVPGQAPRKYLTDYGANASAIFVFDWSLYVTGPTAAQVKAGQISLAALYVQDNVGYLVKPPFDTTINVPGDEPVP